MPDADAVTQEAYGEEVISFGFWPGDHQISEPAFYSYTAPEPARRAEQPLKPDRAFWAQSGWTSAELRSSWCPRPGELDVRMGR